MGLNIKNLEVERLATEVARLAHETKTEAIRKALIDRRARLETKARLTQSSLLEYLSREVWPLIPEAELGRPLSRGEEDEILGFGPDGF
jgi:antitoxin VapB